ncbi:MAG: hypothetical protein HDQ96_02750 [Lachnospiraceae bacterium]|nr:hypothetical protein [Lachnospiraceae bacterium]
MKRVEAQYILKEEGLKHYNLFNEHEIKPFDVVIYEKDNKWIVCSADERANIVDTSYTYYDNEEDALEYFIKLVRLEKVLFK